MLRRISSSEEENVDPSSKNVIRKKVTRTEVEKWEVAQLNSNLEPQSKPSDLFEKLAEKRKSRHEALLCQLAQSLQEVNVKTEKNIEISSMEVKAHMKDYDDKLNAILKSIDIPEVASYSGSVFLKFQNQANDYKARQQKLVDELYEDLIKFEDQRAAENEKIFHVACEEIRKIGHFLPYDVQYFVEHETLKMNQLSLNNRRLYDDLKLTLTLITEQTFKSFMDKVFCIQEKWVQIKVQEAYSKMQNKAEKKVAKLTPEAYTRLELKGQELIIQLTPDNLYSTCKAEEWAKNVDEVVTSIETYGKNLIEIYKKTLNAVFHNFDNEVEEIKKEINSVEMLALEERVIRPIVFEAQSDQNKEIESLEFFWQETLFDIRSVLKDVTEFLLDAGKIWDAHGDRVCESKKLILKALEKAEEVNQGALEELEIKVNLALDALRQEHVKPKLEKAYQAVVVLLESIKSKYESSYLNEVSIVEDFYKMMDLESDVLSAELKEFMYATHSIDLNRNLYHFSEQFRCLPYGKPLLRDIQTCAQQIKAVKSWKYGVWTALENFAQKTRESLQPRAETWVQKKIEDLAERKSIQIELIDKRFERVRIEIYEKRLGEVECHEAALELHKEGIKAGIAKMKADLKSLTTAETEKLNRIKEDFVMIENTAKSENRAGVIQGNKIMLGKNKEEMESEARSTFARFRADSETKSFDMIQTNIKYMKSIKLFYEGGNYSTEEGKAFATSLETVDKEINTEFKNLLRDSTKDENEIIRKISLTFDPIITLFGLLYEETLFNQEIEAKIHGFTEEIRGFAKILKSDFDTLSQQTKCLDKFMRNGDQVFQNNPKIWNCLIRQLYRNVSNLLYPIVFPESSKSSVAEEQTSVKELVEEEEVDETDRCCCTGKLSLKVTLSKTPTFRTTELNESFNCKDLKKNLFHFEDPPENDGTFMAVISNGFWTELDAIQKLTCNFYKKVQGRKIIREDLIPGTYEDYIGELLKRFQCYNDQCEELWLQIILKFLPLVGNIKVALNSYLEKALMSYEETTTSALQTLETDFLSCLESQASKNSEEFEALDKKLLPLHGHPQNKDLLSELEEEVVRRTSGLGIDWEKALNRFKNQLKCFRIHHLKERKEINRIHLQVLSLMEKIFTEDLGNHMLDLILEYSDRGGYWMRRNAYNLLVSKGKEENKDKEEERRGSLEKDNLNLELVSEKLDSVLSYLNQLKNLIERERYPDTIPSECPPCPEGSLEFISVQEEEDPCARYCEPKLNVLLDPINSEVYVEKIMSGLKANCKRLNSLAESQESVQEEALFKWLSVWKFNVKKVQKLYSVRWEEKPENLERRSILSGEFVFTVVK